MAYTVNQSTTGVQGAGDPLVYVVRDTTNTGEPKYRYVCQVTVNSQVVIKLKQLPNNNNAAVFNVQSIAQAYVQQDEDPYQLGLLNLEGNLATNIVYARNTEALNTVTLRFGYEYAATVNDAPVETLLPATDTEVRVVNGYFSEAVDVVPLPSNIAAGYGMDGNGLFLSDCVQYGAEYVYPVADRNDIRSYAALAFLNGDDVNSAGSDYLHVTYYNGSTQLATGYLQNNTTNGGWTPTTGGTDEQSLLYVGIGPMNLQTQTINASLKPSLYTTWTHYFVQFASTTILSGNETSTRYKFVRTDCGKYWDTGHAYTLHWWNSKGGVDSLPCAGMSEESQQMEKKSFRTSGGNSFNANGTSTTYEKRGMEGGKRSTRVRTTTTLKLSVQGGDIDLYTPFIRSLLNSQRVYLSGSSRWGHNSDRASSGVVQAYVTDVSKEYMQSVNREIESYTVTVELSRRLPNS